VGQCGAARYPCVCPAPLAVQSKPDESISEQAGRLALMEAAATASGVCAGSEGVDAAPAGDAAGAAAGAGWAGFQGLSAEEGLRTATAGRLGAGLAIAAGLGTAWVPLTDGPLESPGMLLFTRARGPEGSLYGEVAAGRVPCSASATAVLPTDAAAAATAAAPTTAAGTLGGAICSSAASAAGAAAASSAASGCTSCC
jgi:hypothetical protein